MLEVKIIITTLSLLMSAIDVTTNEELLELTCLEVLQCKQFQHSGINVKCIDGRCQCSAVAGQQVKCKPKDNKLNNIIGGQCPCTQLHAECYMDTCYCAVNFMPSTDRRRCLQKIIHFNGDCELDLQCQRSNAFTICDPKEEKCVCKGGFIAINGACISIVGLNSTCTSDTQCQSSGHAQCAVEQHKCICSEAYTTAANKIDCLANANYHESCTEHVQCQKALGPGGICHKGKCDCDENGKYFAMQMHNEHAIETKAATMKTVCAANVELGQYCRTSNDCYQHQLPELEQTMDCHHGECSCKWGFYSQNECNKASHCGIIRSTAMWVVGLMSAGGIIMGW